MEFVIVNIVKYDCGQDGICVPALQPPNSKYHISINKC